VVTRPNETANLIYHINKHSECAILEEDVGNFGKAARPIVQPDCRFVHTLEVLDCDQQIPTNPLDFDRLSHGRRLQRVRVTARDQLNSSVVSMIVSR
jgi:hypothetical protein